MKGKWKKMKENERKIWKEKTGQQGNIKKTSEGQRKDKVKNMETWSCKQFHHTDKQILINIWCTWLALQRLWSDTDWLTLTWHWLDIDNGLLLTVTLSLTLSTVMSQWVIDNSIPETNQRFTVYRTVPRYFFQPKFIPSEASQDWLQVKQPSFRQCNICAPQHHLNIANFNFQSPMPTSVHTASNT